MCDSEQMVYEVMLHGTWDQWRQTHKGLLIKEVKRVIAAEGDYAAWYYSPSNAKYARMAKKALDEKREAIGEFR